MDDRALRQCGARHAARILQRVKGTFWFHALEGMEEDVNKHGDDVHEALPERTLRDIELTAVELARLAGAEIVSAFGDMLAVRYKGERSAGDEAAWRDPVSEVDHRVELLIRARLAERLPEHDIIGEEIDERTGRTHDVVWAIDPIDGTANLINGFPFLHLLDLGGDIAGNGLSRLFMTIAAAFAELERDRIRERITQVKRDQKARGRFLGGTRPPFGFRAGGGGELVPDEAEQAAIGKAKRMRGRGRSLR